MIEQDPWIHFPSHLNPPTIRSLSLIFILEELAEKIAEVLKPIQRVQFFRTNFAYIAISCYKHLESGKIPFLMN